MTWCSPSTRRCSGSEAPSAVTTQRVPSAVTSTSSARTSALGAAPEPAHRDVRARAAIGAIAATRGSSALSTARPPGRSARTSSDFASNVASIPPKPPAWAMPTISTTPTSGSTSPASRAISPGALAPNSLTRNRVPSRDAQHRQRRADLVVERGARRDGLALVLEDPGEQVLGRGLAVGAGDPDDAEVAAHPRTRATTWRARSARAAIASATTIWRDRDAATTRSTMRDGRAARDGGVDEQVAVGHLAGLGDEDPARARSAASRCRRRRTRGLGRVAGGELELVRRGRGRAERG